jgi:polysaccharide chain length determinant protein (PEP-CTERM system associated)
MHPTENNYSVHRRPMDVEDYFDLLRRHRGWIAGPIFAGLVISVVAAFIWPDTYVSRAVVRIVPPSVPERYVASNVNLQIGQRIEAFYQQVTTRSSLLNLINTFALYPRKKDRVPDDDLVEQMKDDIRLAPIYSTRDALDGRTVTNAFQVSFTYNNRYTAQKVVAEILNSLMNETIRTRSNESVATTKFLQDKVDAAKKELDEIEGKVEAYKRAYAGKLPEELEANLGQLRSLDSQAVTVASQINTATQEKLYTESQIRTLREQLETINKVVENSVTTAARNEALASVERNIQAQETGLTSLRQRFLPDHPDVKKAEALLADLKRKRDELTAQEDRAAVAPAPKRETTTTSTAQLQLERQIADLQAANQVRDNLIAELTKQQAAIQKRQQVYQSNIDAAPSGQRVYVQLTRDYNLARQRYEDLMGKSNQSEMATDLENRKQGEGLDVLEQPTLPQTPSAPNRWLWVATGLSLGAAAGLVLAAVREMRDSSLKSLKDVKAYTGLPVLGSVPLVQSDIVVQRKRRLTWLGWSAATIAGFAMMMGSVYYHFTRGA